MLLSTTGATDIPLFVNNGTALMRSEAITLRGGVVDGGAKIVECRQLAPTAVSGGWSNGVGLLFDMAKIGWTYSPAAS